jgi:hypothetical protein
MMLIQITSDNPPFCAGVVIENERVTVAAPILQYMMGWKWQRLMLYHHEKRNRKVEIMDLGG